MRKLVLTGAVACYAAFIGLASACGSDADSTDGTAGAAAPAGSGNTAQVQDPSTTVGPRVRLRLTGQLEGYLGMCSCNSIYTYEFTVYAMPDATLVGLDMGSTKEEAAAAIEAAALASVAISGES